MLVTVTFEISTPDQKHVLYTDIYAYVDIEVTDEEYKAIGESFESQLFRGMHEDESLSDICDRCREALSGWGFEEEFGDNFIFRFDYPIETRIDHSETVWKAGYDEVAGSELVPPDAELFENNDGTFSVWWPGESA